MHPETITPEAATPETATPETATPETDRPRGAQPEEPTTRPLGPFFFLWTGQAVSLLFSQGVQFALIWWLTTETGSPTVLSLAALVGLLPQVLLGPLAGTLVDRWSRKKVLFFADATAALAMLALAGLFQLGIAGVPHVFAALFAGAVAGGFHAPAMLASTSLMVPERHLARIQGLNEALRGSLVVVSAPLGALLVATLPLPAILALDPVFALAAILPLARVAIPQPPRSAESTGSPSVLREMADGFRFLRAWPGLLLLVLVAAGLNLLLTPAFSLLPLLVTEHFGGGAAQLGWIQSLFGIGSLAGGVLLGVWGGFRRRMHTALAGLAALGGAVVALGAAPATAFSVALGAMFDVGLSAPLVNGPIVAILQARVEPAMQGRVLSLLGSLSLAAAPVGLALAGPAAEAVGLRSLYLAAGMLCVAAGAAGFALPALRRIEAPRAGTITAP